MGPHVCLGSTLMCSFGLAPGTFVVAPTHQAFATMPAANVGDAAPIANITPFGACTSPSNPTVAAATAAALGVLTPMPCIPVPAGPWLPGSAKVMLQGLPALDATSKAICAWGGSIQVVNPSQTKVIDG